MLQKLPLLIIKRILLHLEPLHVVRFLLRLNQHFRTTVASYTYHGSPVVFCQIRMEWDKDRRRYIMELSTGAREGMSRRRSKRFLASSYEALFTFLIEMNRNAMFIGIAWIMFRDIGQIDDRFLPNLSRLICQLIPAISFEHFLLFFYDMEVTVSAGWMAFLNDLVSIIPSTVDEMELSLSRVTFPDRTYTLPAIVNTGLYKRLKTFHEMECAYINNEEDQRLDNAFSSELLAKVLQNVFARSENADIFFSCCINVDICKLSTFIQKWKTGAFYPAKATLYLDFHGHYFAQKLKSNRLWQQLITTLGLGHPDKEVFFIRMDNEAHQPDKHRRLLMLTKLVSGIKLRVVKLADVLQLTYKEARRNGRRRALSYEELAELSPFSFSFL